MSRLPNEDAMEDYFAALLDEPTTDLKQDHDDCAPAMTATVTDTVADTAELGSSNQSNSGQPLQTLLNGITSKHSEPEPIEPELQTQLQPLPAAFQPVLSFAELAADVDGQLSQFATLGAVLPSKLVFAEPESELSTIVETTTDTQVAIQAAPLAQAAEPQWQNIDPEDEFQALFFEVAGISFAVMLTELGGIHKIDHVNSIFGKPAWFSGIMTRGDKQFNVVDTAKWIMADKAPQDLDYQYIILLDDTQWGLSCCKLIGTEKLTKDQVKWRDQEGKRPWLAGMVKQRMCALLHVSELIKLLSRGVDITGH